MQDDSKKDNRDEIRQLKRKYGYYELGFAALAWICVHFHWRVPAVLFIFAAKLLWFVRSWMDD